MTVSPAFGIQPVQETTPTTASASSSSATSAPATATATGTEKEGGVVEAEAVSNGLRLRDYQLEGMYCI